MSKTTRRRAVSGKAQKTALVPFCEWTGENADELRKFCQRGDVTNFMVISDDYARIEYQDVTFTAQVHDWIHKTWIPLRSGDMVMKGPKDECWPVARDVFNETYSIKESWCLPSH